MFSENQNCQYFHAGKNFFPRPTELIIGKKTNKSMIFNKISFCRIDFIGMIFSFGTLFAESKDRKSNILIK